MVFKKGLSQTFLPPGSLEGFTQQEIVMAFPILLCYREPPLPQGVRLPSLFGILVAVNTSSLESCSGESPLGIGYSNLS